jgi:outer membrane protein assembly factor BamA/outer membrane protein assembly factor BamE (lipoprotein component of BamABCDE complex)
LHIAAQKGYPQLVEALLANNANVNAKNFYGDTPLMWAADKGRMEVVGLLLANQAEINAGNMLGQTALHVAALAGHKAVAEVLLGHGADVNVRNIRGYTPLELVTGEVNNDLAELLRKHMIMVAEETDFGPVGAAVGEFGDPGRLVFEGIETFTEKALIRRLMVNPDFLLASHAAAPLAEYLQTLRRLLLSGYQANGFPRAEVTTSVDRGAGRIVVKMAEGPRYVAGGVKVLGAKTIPVEQLIRRLTELSPALESATPASRFDNGVLKTSAVSELPLFGPEQPESTGKKVEPEPPIWQKGKPAPFAEASLNGLADGVTRAFHHLGYFFAKANVRVIPGNEKRAADLLVEILDEGPRAVVGKIDVTGNRKNTHDEILEYLGLTPDMAFSRDLVMKMERLLWRSARFLDYEVSAEFLDATGAQEPKVKLNVKLTEYDPAPPLFKELSHEERALLNLRDWLADVPYPSEDIVISINRQRSESRTEVVKFIISHQRALVLISDGSAGGQGNLGYAGVFSPEIVALYSPSGQRKLVDIGPPRQLWNKVSILSLPGRDVEEGFGLLFSAGIKTPVFKNGVSPFRFDILVAPVLFVAAAHSKNHTYAFSEGVLTVSNEHERILVDAQSGKLLEYTGSIPEENGDEPGGGMHPPLSLPPTFDLIRPEAAFDPPVQLAELGFTVIPEKGAFDRAIKELEEATAGHRNFMDAQTPLSSWVGYLADELFQTEFFASSLLKDIPTEQRGRALSALRKIFPRPILSPLDKLISRYSAEGEESFYIPSDWPETTEAETDSLSSFLSAIVYRFADESFPQGTWAPAAARAAVFLFGGESKYAQAELKRVYESEETGPLGYLTIATLLTYIGEVAITIEHPAPADFARRGLERLSVTDFRKDVRLFLEGESILEENIEEMAAALRDLDDQDIEALAALLPPGVGNSVPQIVRGIVWLLREGKDKPIEEALYPALEKYWDKMLKREVETALRKLAATKAAKLAPEPPISETTLTKLPPVPEGLLSDSEHSRYTNEVGQERSEGVLVTQTAPLTPEQPRPGLAQPQRVPAVRRDNPETDVTAESLMSGGIIKEIRVKGMQRIEPETVRAYMRVNPGDTFDPLRLDKSLKNLFSTGLFADVTLWREGDALVVTVVENPIINRVAYEGNEHLDDENLAREVVLRPRVVFTRTKAMSDTQRLLEIYRRSGRNAAIVQPKVIQLPQNRIDLVFEIDEGPLIATRKIGFIGNRAFSDGRLREEISSTDTYDPDRLTFDRELLRRFYLKEGYADFRVLSVVAELLPDREGFIVTFTVEEGERQKFGNINIAATLPRLEPESLRQYVVAKEGEWYNAVEIEDTIDNLTEVVGNMGYAFVDIRPRAERDRENRLIHVTFEIQEGPKVFVERIDIQGNERTLDRVVRREFRLVEGDAFNAAKLRRSRQRIRNLGFFRTADVETQQGSAPDKTLIAVAVEEQSTGELSFRAGVSSVEGPIVYVSFRERNLLGRGQDVWLSIKLTGRGQQLDLSFFEPYFLASKSTRARPPALGACEQSVQIRGNLPDPEVVSKISPGIHSRIDIQRLLGSPSTVSTFQDSTWHYIGHSTTQFGFCEPEVLERKVLVVSFDDIGLVAGTKTYTLEDGQIVDPVDRITPTKGRETFVAPRPPGPLHHPRRRPEVIPEADAAR